MKRKPFQGVWNIIRFNWPFYAISLGLILTMAVGLSFLRGTLFLGAELLLVAFVGMMLLSLLVSWYVYDLSHFYELAWLDAICDQRTKNIVNVNAGFDETSHLLADKYEGAELTAFDFYDAEKHTEASIKRARKAYPPFTRTQVISTDHVPLADGSVDQIFVILSAHEIRDAHERRVFFNELDRILTVRGRIVVVEHLRDAANWIAYNIGALHFQPRSTWMRTFCSAQLKVEAERKITPFITAFFLTKNGVES